LLALTLLFWKLRILDTGVELELTLANIDLYDSHYPMTWFGFGALREGRLPLWNPWQFAGEPLLAAYYAGLFYPLNALYLFVSVPFGIEISGVLHMLLGACGIAALAQRLRIDWPGAVLAAFTFVWSGWFVFSANQPRILSAMAWMPWTCWLVDRVLAGQRRAGFALALGIAAQLLIGDAEHVLHGWLAAALLAALRLGQLAWRGAWRDALARGALCAGCLLAGAGLAAFQLLPTAELVSQSARGAADFDVRNAISQGLIIPRNFLLQAAQTRHWVTAGVLPLVAGLLALGRGRGAVPWLLGACAALLGAQLCFGGALFRLYHELPFADLFRRPYKFLDLYAFGQALLTGLALARLSDQAGLPRGRLWRDPRWLAAVLGTASLLIFMYRSDRGNPWLAALLLALVLYGALDGARLRRVAVLLIAGVQLASLFFGSSNTYVRPIHRPETLAAQREIFPVVRARGDQARVYLSPRLWSVPGFSLKQGMLNGVGVVNDYEPLALARYAEYFGAVSPWRSPDGLFNGRYRLIGDTPWRLLDLTGTRFYVLRRGEEAAVRMSQQPPAPDGGGFRKIAEGEIQAFERAAALPRAWWVPRERDVSSAAAALSALRSSGFDPRQEVILERAPGAERPGGRPSAQEATEAGELAASAQVAIQAYAPEQVEISLLAPRAGWLVLSDLYYPGWVATVNGDPAQIERANHLFRAVRVAAGPSTVRFSYRPASLRRGALVSLASALLLAALFLRGARSRSRGTAAV
jgi:Bacterial membrane protein YfhO